MSQINSDINIREIHSRRSEEDVNSLPLTIHRVRGGGKNLEGLCSDFQVIQKQSTNYAIENPSQSFYHSPQNQEIDSGPGTGVDQLIHMLWCRPAVGSCGRGGFTGFQD